MKKPKIKVTVIKENTGYSANALAGENFISTGAENFQELKTNLLEALSVSFEDKGFTYTIEEISFDFESFFDIEQTRFKIEIKPIRSEAEYKNALERLEMIFDAKRGTKEGDELEILSILIDNYESENFPN
jgi:hypothetical protein